MAEASFDLAAAHRWFAVNCFNQAWELIDRKSRSSEEDEKMIGLAMASLWHWTQRADCTAVNLSIGYWQVARVYTLAGQIANARRYAEMCREISSGVDIPPFYLGYAHEALARAEAVAGNRSKADSLLEEARRLAGLVEETEDREVLLADLRTI